MKRAVRVGATLYDVRPAKMGDEEGDCDFRRTLIRYESRASAARQEEIVTHELVHAALAESGALYDLEAMLSLSADRVEMQEVIARQLVPCLLAALHDAGIVQLSGPDPGRREGGATRQNPGTRKRRRTSRPVRPRA